MEGAVPFHGQPKPDTALGGPGQHPPLPSAPTWCKFSLYSLLGSFPSATIMTLFFPKKILRRERR